MNELNKLELEEINEDDGDETEEEETQCRRRTILDKVVGNVFGKSKQNLYESKYLSSAHTQTNSLSY